MISKKAQQEIIVTVLLVLIALAAVAAVATFVINNVKKSTAGADDKLACSKVELSIADLKASATAVAINVQRLGTADVTLTTVNVMVNGVKITGTGTGAILPGETKSAGNSILVKDQKVEAAAILANGYACAPMASTTVAA